MKTLDGVGFLFTSTLHYRTLSHFTVTNLGTDRVNRWVLSLDINVNRVLNRDDKVLSKILEIL